MSKNKKKRTVKHDKKLEVRQNKNKFFAKARQVAVAWDAQEAFDLIPSEELSVLYVARFRAVRIDRGKNNDLPGKFFKNFRKTINDTLKNIMVEIRPGGKLVSMYDFYTVVVSLKHYLRILEEDDFPKAHVVKQAFTPFLDHWNNYREVEFEFYSYLEVLTTIFSRLDKKFIWFESGDWPEETNLSNQVYDLIEMNFLKPEKKVIRLDGHKRMIIKVGWGSFFNGFNWITIQAADLGIECAFKDLALEVYLQAHVLHRLNERLEGFGEASLHFYLWNSLREPKVQRGVNDELLIEYRLNDMRLGYLKADIIEGMVVLRTFLFITNDCTPEGQLLKAFTGMQKMDKKYWEIDKLSTFVMSDIKDHAVLRELFEKIGCGHLFEIQESHLYGVNKTAQADSLMAFIEQNKELDKEMMHQYLDEELVE
ncbi:hypothetical protein DMA11_20895 [Marinilabiliaceae bacterium JC017]|nr:hypothetical protein DMA11_20895 [Marinilabiliaceae bacterium JC017]